MASKDHPVSVALQGRRRPLERALWDDHRGIADLWRFPEDPLLEIHWRDSSGPRVAPVDLDQWHQPMAWAARSCAAQAMSLLPEGYLATMSADMRSWLAHEAVDLRQVRQDHLACERAVKGDRGGRSWSSARHVASDCAVRAVDCALRADTSAYLALRACFQAARAQRIMRRQPEAISVMEGTLIALAHLTVDGVPETWHEAVGGVRQLYGAHPHVATPYLQGVRQEMAADEREELDALQFWR